MVLPPGLRSPVIADIVQVSPSGVIRPACVVGDCLRARSEANFELPYDSSQGGNCVGDRPKLKRGLFFALVFSTMAVGLLFRSLVLISELVASSALRFRRVSMRCNARIGVAVLKPHGSYSANVGSCLQNRHEGRAGRCALACSTSLPAAAMARRSRIHQSTRISPVRFNSPTGSSFAHAGWLSRAHFLRNIRIALARDFPRRLFPFAPKHLRLGRGIMLCRPASISRSRRRAQIAALDRRSTRSMGPARRRRLLRVSSGYGV